MVFVPALWLLGPIPCWSLKLTISPGGSDESPVLVPGGEIHIDITPESGHPEKIDIWLHDVVLNNKTMIWDDLEPAKSIHSIFDVPVVPPGRQYLVRATLTNNEFLSDSSPFEIFAKASDATKNSTSISQSLPTTSTLSLIPTATNIIQESGPNNISGAGDGATNTPKKPLVGAIVGGALGGLVFIVIVSMLVLYLRCRRRRGHALPAERKEISPFTVTRPLVIGAGGNSDLGMMTGPTSPASPETIAHFNQYPNSDSKSNRSWQMVSIYTPESESRGRDTISSRQDEEAVSVVRDEIDVRRELETLREQVRRLERREESSWVRENALSEPPPDYTAARNGRS